MKRKYEAIDVRPLSTPGDPDALWRQNIHLVDVAHIEEECFRSGLDLESFVSLEKQPVVNPEGDTVVISDGDNEWDWENAEDSNMEREREREREKDRDREGREDEDGDIAIADVEDDVKGDFMDLDDDLSRGKGAGPVRQVGDNDSRSAGLVKAASAQPKLCPCGGMNQGNKVNPPEVELLSSVYRAGSRLLKRSLTSRATQSMTASFGKGRLCVRGGVWVTLDTRIESRPVSLPHEILSFLRYHLGTECEFRERPDDHFLVCSPESRNAALVV
ncbi:hypothetical protein HDU97_010325 [Phlyctochytrium planicorne]|nr:hypothetical protein HDU97_010325 [Phlyctochytrium planicorne]